MRLAASLLRPARPTGQHALLAAAAWSAGHGAAAVLATGRAPGGVRGLGGLAAGLDGLGDLCELEPASAAEFAALQRCWELLKLDPAQATRRLATGHRFVLALLATRCAPSTMARLEERVKLLSAAPGPTIDGRAVAETQGVPPHLRGHLIAQLHVLCRLRGEAPELRTAAQVHAYLETRCRGLLTRMRAEWWRDEERGELRPEYDKRASSRWLHD